MLKVYVLYKPKTNQYKHQRPIPAANSLATKFTPAESRSSLKVETIASLTSDTHSGPKYLYNKQTEVILKISNLKFHIMTSNHLLLFQLAKRMLDE